MAGGESAGEVLPRGEAELPADELGHGVKDEPAAERRRAAAAVAVLDRYEGFVAAAAEVEYVENIEDEGVVRGLKMNIRRRFLLEAMVRFSGRYRLTFPAVLWPTGELI